MRFRARLVKAEKFEHTPLMPHVTMHPGKGHLGINKIVTDLGQRRGLIPVYKPMPRVLQEAYAEAGSIWEDTIEEQHRRRQSCREGKWVANTQVRMCVERIHMIPDNVWTKKAALKLSGTPLERVLAQKPTQLDEYKNKFTSACASDIFLQKHWGYAIVTHCYARAIGVNLVRFVVNWNGRQPDPMEYVFEYHRGDMDDAWDMVLEHRDRMKKRERRG